MLAPMEVTVACGGLDEMAQRIGRLAKKDKGYTYHQLDG
jgi:hypothetical protein